MKDELELVKIVKNPYKYALDKFLQSKKGEACLKGQAVGEYLKNRIIIAFEAGVEAANFIKEYSK